MVRFDDHIREIRRCEAILEHPKNDRQKIQITNRLKRLRKEYREAKMWATRSGK